MKVFVSGCYDLLHSGHVEFFRQAARYGDLYVGIGSDSTILQLKHHHTMFPEDERLFMVKSVRYVTDAYINQGSGMLDFLPTLDIVHPDVFVVNADGSSEAKEQLCRERGIRYVVLQRTPHEGLKARSSTDLKTAMGAPASTHNAEGLPTRLDLAGTWIDQPYVSCHHPGWAITISLNATFEVRNRCGLSTSTRNVIKQIWPDRLPDMDSQTLARLVFCYENHPERRDGHVSGAQDAIGICVSGLARHYYDNQYWPERIETCSDSKVIDWLENHLVMIPLEPRRPGLSVVDGSDITPEKVARLADAASRCWDAILNCRLDEFAQAYRDSFEAQTSMFPAMIDPVVDGVVCPEASVRPAIDRWSRESGVLAWKMPGAGGGGYLALVVDDAPAFVATHAEAIPLSIRK